MAMGPDDPTVEVANAKYGPVGQRLSPQDRRRHLLCVAREIVETQGTCGLTMESVSKAAGVSRSLLYAYFDSRAGLLGALWDEVAVLWDVESMPPVEPLSDIDTLRQTFEDRMIANTRWFFDQIERCGLLFHRLMSEAELAEPAARLHKRMHHDNVQWWADLVELMGVDRQKAMVYSELFNGTTQVLWELIVRAEHDREVIEEVLFVSMHSSLDRLLEHC